MPGDRKCIVPKCGHSKYNTPDMKLYGFPKDPKLKLKWMENIKVKRLFNRYSYVCGIHFEEKVRCEARLKKNAVPTLHLGYDGPVPHEFIKHYTPERKCCVESCKRKNLYKNRIIYRFPKNIDEKYAWAQACKLPLPLPSKKIYICGRHFEEEYVTKVRLCAGAFPKFFLTGEDDEDVEQSDESSYDSEAVKTDEGSFDSDLELTPYQKQIRKLNREIEMLRSRILFLESNVIYPQPEASAESLIFARMILGDEEIDYTDKEKDLAKNLRSNISSIAYRFMKQEIGCRLPTFTAAEIFRFKIEKNDRIT
ncbi:uncharacterized protein LOC101452391 [Ceratitis capitata]|uniref:(Mediterranean fruit fly) hypothetical protein n=1 Tax=Ceratitis capitata TaxID=7213 RepID=W8B8Z3_CERCA|nr:uncharacterized protein LOC101452391 [Ceratitis capitata]CAD7012544.1 unnamed protein product [Ceratitis capitata]